MALAGLIIAYVALTAWWARVNVSQSERRHLYICDKHGPTAVYHPFEEDLEWETKEGQRRRGRVDICALCFEEAVKSAGTKLPPLPKNITIERK